MGRKNHIKRSNSYIHRKERENHFSDNTLTLDGSIVGESFPKVHCPKYLSHASAMEKVKKQKAKISY